MDFETGDSVRNIGRGKHAGMVGEVIDTEELNDTVFVEYSDGTSGHGNQKYYEPASVSAALKTNQGCGCDLEEKTPMFGLQSLDRLSNLIKRTFSDDTKTLYRAGYLTADLNITKKLTDAIGEMFVGHIIDGTINEASLGSFATELVAQAKAEVEAAEKEAAK